MKLITEYQHVVASWLSSSPVCMLRHSVLDVVIDWYCLVSFAHQSSLQWGMARDEPNRIENGNICVRLYCMLSRINISSNDRLCRVSASLMKNAPQLQTLFLIWLYIFVFFLLNFQSCVKQKSCLLLKRSLSCKIYFTTYLE